MDTFERWLLAGNRWVLIVLLAVMALIIFANVGLRYLTNESIEWAEEVARHLMIWLTFLGAGPVLRYGGHIAVDNLQDSLPRGLAVALRCVIALLLLGFCLHGLVRLALPAARPVPDHGSHPDLLCLGVCGHADRRSAADRALAAGRARLHA